MLKAFRGLKQDRLHQTRKRQRSHSYILTQTEIFG
jgi:hypothetical protein